MATEVRQKKGGEEERGGCKKCGGGGRLARSDSTRLSPAISLGKVMEGEGEGEEERQRKKFNGGPVRCADKMREYQPKQNMLAFFFGHFWPGI